MPFATQMPDTPPEAKDVKQVQSQAFPPVCKDPVAWSTSCSVVFSFIVTVMPPVKGTLKPWAKCCNCTVVTVLQPCTTFNILHQLTHSLLLFTALLE